jgi:hypothetical protein
MSRLSDAHIGVQPTILERQLQVALDNMPGALVYTDDDLDSNEGILVGAGLIGTIVAVGAAVLFAAVMLFQALTGSGNSH